MIGSILTIVRTLMWLVWPHVRVNCLCFQADIASKPWAAPVWCFTVKKPDCIFYLSHHETSRKFVSLILPSSHPIGMNKKPQNQKTWCTSSKKMDESETWVSKPEKASSPTATQIQNLGSNFCFIELFDQHRWEWDSKIAHQSSATWNVLTVLF